VQVVVTGVAPNDTVGVNVTASDWPFVEAW